LCWDSPAPTRSRRLSRPPPPWSNASPVIHGAKYGLYQIYSNEPWHQELPPEVIDYACTLGREPVSTQSPRAGRKPSQIVGLIMARYVVAVEPLASMPAEQVAAAVAATMERYLVGPLGTTDPAICR
jgi:hypothetical protein